MNWLFTRTCHPQPKTFHGKLRMAGLSDTIPAGRLLQTASQPVLGTVLIHKPLLY